MGIGAVPHGQGRLLVEGSRSCARGRGTHTKPGNDKSGAARGKPHRPRCTGKAPVAVAPPAIPTGAPMGAATPWLAMVTT